MDLTKEINNNVKGDKNKNIEKEAMTLPSITPRNFKILKCKVGKTIKCNDMDLESK